MPRLSPHSGDRKVSPTRSQRTSEMKHEVTRRELLTGVGIASVAAVVDNPAKAQSNEPQQSFNTEAGPDRIVVLNGRTYLRGWAGYGERPRRKGEWQITDVAAASI